MSGRARLYTRARARVTGDWIGVRHWGLRWTPLPRGEGANGQPLQLWSGFNASPFQKKYSVHLFVVPPGDKQQWLIKTTWSHSVPRLSLRSAQALSWDFRGPSTISKLCHLREPNSRSGETAWVGRGCKDPELPPREPAGAGALGAEPGGCGSAALRVPPRLLSHHGDESGSDSFQERHRQPVPLPIPHTPLKAGTQDFWIFLPEPQVHARADTHTYTHTHQPLPLNYLRN